MAHKISLQDVERVYRHRLATRPGSLDNATLADAFAIMFDYYADVRVLGCSPWLWSERDMLLYEWASADSKSWAINLTRQLMVRHVDEPYQLTLRFTFDHASTPLTDGSGVAWCESPRRLRGFRKMVEHSAAYRSACSTPFWVGSLTFGQC